MAPGVFVLKRTSVSIRKYGMEEAFQRACAIRQKQERKLYGGAIQDVSELHAPIARKVRAKASSKNNPKVRPQKNLRSAPAQRTRK